MTASAGGCPYAPPHEVPGGGFNQAVVDLLDHREPQDRYRTLMEQGVFDFGPDLIVVFDRPSTEYVLKHSDRFSTHIEMHIGNVRPLKPLNIDPPLHTMYRRLVNPMFGPKAMDAREEDFTNRVNGLIDTFIDRGECNFHEEFAEIFPSSVFLGLCGLPEEELPRFLHMRDGIMHPEKFDPEAITDPERRAAVNDDAASEIYEYFTELIDKRRADPRDDMITSFLQHEADGERLSDEDILDVCFNFVVAGLDTVSSSLSCMFAYLAQHPEHRRQVASDPEVVTPAVEELLRWESPVTLGIPRVATEDMELPNGRTVRKGAAVAICYGSANVDEQVFEDPFTVRFDRVVNRHIAFAGGAHRCLGSHLARRELRVALREWHRRIPEYGIKPGHEELEYPQGIRHVPNLVLAW